MDPVHPHTVLKKANAGVEIVTTIELVVDTTTSSGGISNVPFVKKQADVSQMKSTFWIQELAEKDDQGRPKMRLQYLQVVMLDFFPRLDGVPGLMGWPHVSVNTLARV